MAEPSSSEYSANGRATVTLAVAGHAPHLFGPRGRTPTALVSTARRPLLSTTLSLPSRTGPVRGRSSARRRAWGLAACLAQRPPRPTAPWVPSTATAPPPAVAASIAVADRLCRARPHPRLSRSIRATTSTKRLARTPISECGSAPTGPRAGRSRWRACGPRPSASRSNDERKAPEKEAILPLSLFSFPSSWLARACVLFIFLCAVEKPRPHWPTRVLSFAGRPRLFFPLPPSFLPMYMGHCFRDWRFAERSLAADTLLLHTALHTPSPRPRTAVQRERDRGVSVSLAMVERR